MKNSTWTWSTSEPIETLLTKATGREFPLDISDDRIEHISVNKIEAWDCRWCCCVNAIGLAVCERCGMPR